MTILSSPEYWLRGPVENIPALLQPAAHALLQARDEVKHALIDFPEEHLWSRTANVASVAFHLQHIPGVISRLFTYAKGESLTQEQLNYLAEEGKQKEGITLAALLNHFDQQVDMALAQLKITDPAQLTETRFVGRKQIPSTVLGLIFHAAEHTMRHTGQLLVTVAVLKSAQYRQTHP
jgi:uncharacterized damage-inducible protein DinB